MRTPRLVVFYIFLEQGHDMSCTTYVLITYAYQFVFGGRGQRRKIKIWFEGGVVYFVIVRTPLPLFTVSLFCLRVPWLANGYLLLSASRYVVMWVNNKALTVQCWIDLRSFEHLNSRQHRKFNLHPRAEDAHRSLASPLRACFGSRC